VLLSLRAARAAAAIDGIGAVLPSSRIGTMKPRMRREASLAGMFSPPVSLQDGASLARAENDFKPTHSDRGIAI
jgi:hypothetical protein